MNCQECEIYFTVFEFVQLIIVPKIVNAEDFEIYLHQFKRDNLCFWKLSPRTDKNEILEPRFVQGLPFNGEYAPQINDITGLFTMIFKYFIRKHDRLYIA